MATRKAAPTAPKTKTLAPKPGSVQARALAAQASTNEPPPGASPTPPDRPKVRVEAPPFPPEFTPATDSGPAYFPGERHLRGLLVEFVHAFDKGYSREDFEPLIARARALVR